MPWQILLNPRAAVIVVVSLMILTLPIFPIEVVETSQVLKPYTYEQSLVRTNQSRPFPWFYQVTKAQYTVTNNDTQQGKFSLNFTFDNGEDTQTIIKAVTIQAGEKKAVTIYSHLKGISTVTLNVLPPKKSITQQRTITKNVSAWQLIFK